MPSITFHNGAASSPALIVYYMDLLLFQATLTSADANGFTATVGPLSFEVAGTNLGYTQLGGSTYLTSGMVNDIDIATSGELTMRISALNLSAATLLQVIQAEESGSNIAAAENLLMNLDYSYFGGDSPDILPDNLVSPDGIALELRGNDYFWLAGGSDNVFLGAGHDTAYGGGGNDTLFGGDGNDWLFGDDDFLNSRNGKDVLTGGNGDDEAFGGALRDRLRGDGGNDTLHGGDGHDLLFGGSRDDQLNGDAGSDSITGGRGADMMFGGSGADVFIYTNRNETGRKSNADTIGDFRSGTDKIDISALDLTFDGRTFSGEAGSARFVVRDGGGQLQFDYDGDGKADAVVFLGTLSSLAETDLIL